MKDSGMTLNNQIIAVLEEELIPAMGCTEPIAIALAAATAAGFLDETPDKVEIIASGNIIKNVKSVVVPNTNGMKGIEAAAAAGIVAGNPDAGLEVLAGVSEEDKERISDYLKNTEISVSAATGNCVLDITAKVYRGPENATVRIAQEHTKIVYAEKNGEILVNTDIAEEPSGQDSREFLTVENAWEFAGSADISEVECLVKRQIDYNMAIASEGLSGDYGASVGKVVRDSGSDSIEARCIAYASAGSDARMNGCEMPVIINSGSGNQGITVSVPVAVYADYLGVSQEKLIRAVAFSNLVSIHLKSKVGRLSAYCGAVSAGCAAVCGIAYLNGEPLELIDNIITNTLGISSGIICDGAKASCAGKIAVSLGTGFLGYKMARMNRCFAGGDGIIKENIESTISSVGTVAKEGMRQTDRTILDVMLH